MSSSSSYASTVNSFYLAFYGRPADPAGLKFWSQQIADANGELGMIAKAFGTSEEAQTRFSASSNADRISEIYHQLFNRAPDAEGLAYWVNVVNSGAASMSEVSLAIMNGAQSTDHSLVTVRQEAMERFTKQVEASGSDYSGYAAVEAARVLVRAITLDTKTDDVATLVKSTVEFAAVATKTPAVVGAIAAGGTLLDLFDTTRGAADPLALVEALTGTAKAAAVNEGTLGALMRDGGMAQVLKVMPTDVSLKDAAKALATGDVAAAIKGEYQPAPAPVATLDPAPKPAPAPEPVPEPVVELKLAFKGVTQGEHDTRVDSMTNVAHATVQFSYTGKDLVSGQHFEFSTDGVHWNTAGIKVSAADKTVTVDNVDLSLGHILGYPGNPNPVDDGTRAKVTSFSMRAVDAHGTATAPVSQGIWYDHYENAPGVMLKNDSNFPGDKVSTDGAFTLNSVGEGSIVEYQIGSATEWTTKAPIPHEGVNEFSVRQTDVSGNVSEAMHVTITVDNVAPAAPVASLLVDNGADSTDHITGIGKVVVSSLETAANSRWQFSTDGGLHWQYGPAVSDDGKAQLDFSEYGNREFNLVVRQFDVAGNGSDVSNTLKFTVDTSLPSGNLAFYGVEQPSFAPWETALSSADVYFKYGADHAPDETFQYRVNGGDWVVLDAGAYNSDNQILTVGKVDLSQGDLTVEVRVIDASGHAGNPVGHLIDNTTNNVPHGVDVQSARIDMSGEPGQSQIHLSTPPFVILNGGPADSGLINKATLSLQDLSTGVATDVDYAGSGSFHLAGDGIVLSGTPTLDLYQLSWQDDTFRTSDPSHVGYVNAGSVTFAGGTSGSAVVEGFTAKAVMLTGDVIQPNGWEETNTAYIDSGNLVARVETGLGMDVVVDNGSTLTIVCDAFDSRSTDIILGFDSGNDRIEFAGPAAAGVIDDNHDGVLDWVTGSGKLAVGKAEAVELLTDGPISTAWEDMGVTVATLNAGLDLTGIQQHDDLLILVRGTDHAALFCYHENDGNGKIDDIDLIVVSVFDNGSLQHTDVQLVGSAVTPP